MVRSIIGITLGLFMLTGCDGSFRYPCQDPANWESADCKPPICTVNGACPEDLVDLDKLNNSNTSQDTVNP